MTIIRLRMLNDDSSSGVSEMTIDPSPSLFDAPIAALASAVDGDDRTPLLPVRHPNQDLFICDVLDAIPKDDMASMEHPVFSLSTALLQTLTRFPRLGSCTVKVSCDERFQRTAFYRRGHPMGGALVLSIRHQLP